MILPVIFIIKSITLSCLIGAQLNYQCLITPQFNEIKKALNSVDHERLLLKLKKKRIASTALFHFSKMAARGLLRKT